MTIGIGSLWEIFADSKIGESLLGSSGVVSCPRISNRCKLGFANQHTGSYNPATELELIRFWSFPFSELVWNLITQVNDGLLAAYIAVFDPSMGKCMRCVPFMVYNMIYTNICINLTTLDTLSPWSVSVCIHTWSPFLRNPILRWYRTVKTRLLINYYLALNSFRS